MRRAGAAAGKLLMRGIWALLLANLVLCMAGIRPVAVVSGSMEPAIRTGSISWINFRCVPEDLEKGQILAFERSDGRMVLHRIMEIGKDGIKTKGDANEKPDPAIVRPDQVKGKVLFSLPFAGYLFMEEGGRRGILLLLSGAGVILLYYLEKVKCKKSNIQREI